LKINSKDTNNFKVCVVGSGRAAHFFAHRINHTSAAFELVGIVSRNMNMVSESLFPFSIYDYSCIPEADIFILAVPDDCIRTIAKQIPYAEALFLHCSGAQELIINTEQKHQGVLYPLLSLNFQMEFASNVPLFTETNSEYHKPILNQLAKQLSTNVQELTSEKRLNVHLCAVISQNFSNHLWHIAQDICVRRNLDFKWFKPLLEQGLSQALSQNANETQTGPAVRKDRNTIEKHLKLLSNSKWKDIYKHLNQSIIDTYEEKL
tara:strand:+ start:1384 stop:2172 length:789 start_codon:yes stop_codon:yes gene_type:complete